MGISYRFIKTMMFLRITLLVAVARADWTCRIPGCDTLNGTEVVKCTRRDCVGLQPGSWRCINFKLHPNPYGVKVAGDLTVKPGYWRGWNLPTAGKCVYCVRNLEV